MIEHNLSLKQQAEAAAKKIEVQEKELIPCVKINESGRTAGVLQAQLDELKLLNT